MILTHLILFNFFTGEGGTTPPPATPTGGWIFGRKPKKILLTIRGQRFLVQEDDLDRWLEKREEELVDSAVPQKQGRARVKKPKAAPQIVAKTDDAQVHALVERANERVRETVAAIRAGAVADYLTAEQRRKQIDDDDEETILLCL